MVNSHIDANIHEQLSDYNVVVYDNWPTDNWPKVNLQTKTDWQKIFTDTTTDWQWQVADTTTQW